MENLFFSLKFFHHQCRAACGRKGKTYLFFLLFSIINAELPVINRPSHWSSPFITAHFLYLLSFIFVIFFIIIIILVIFFCSALGNVFSYDPSLQHFIWSISFHKDLSIKDVVYWMISRHGYSRVKRLLSISLYLKTSGWAKILLHS